MLRMILADDEPVIMRGIKKLVDWEKLGISVVGEYENGQSAMEAILTYQPELALLDISMPGMDGIQILKSIHEMELKTKVIFISGFQHFEYAKSAITYGAVEYLLKPVILEQLLSAVEKAVSMIYTKRQEPQKPILLQEKREETIVELEETTYIPVLAVILFDGKEGAQERKLLNFSLISFLEEYLAEEKNGILFSKNENIVMVLKGISVDEAKSVLMQLWKQSQEATGKRTGFVIGNRVKSMGEIPRQYQKCAELSRYFFFADQIQVPVLIVGKDVFFRKSGTKELSEIREKMLESILFMDDTALEEQYQLFCKSLCLAAEGRKEDACYYFCSTVRRVEERMKELGVITEEVGTGELLEQGRQCNSFSEMKEFFGQIIQKSAVMVKGVMESSEKKDILQAKKYIEDHYQENLTLEILAKQIHMKPYYFSSFFKKHAGENFKDYVSKVRLSHAVSLLLTTDLKTYEVAEQAGFRDARCFTEVFSRMYKETPSAYRKRTLGE